jgi:hypothetical protein
MLELCKYRWDKDAPSVVLKRIRPLCGDEEQEYRAASRRLSDFEQTRDLMALVAGNLEEVREQIQAFEASQAERPAPDQGNAERRNLNRVVVNYLTSVRLYIDHRQAHLARRPVSSPEPWKLFAEPVKKPSQSPSTGLHGCCAIMYNTAACRSR